MGNIRLKDSLKMVSDIASVMVKDESRNDMMGYDPRLAQAGDVRIRSIHEVKTDPRTLVSSLYFEGLTILKCLAGEFKFVIDDSQTLVIGANELLTIYPDHRVTIEATQPGSRVVYVIFHGEKVCEFFDSLGYFDFLRGTAKTQYENLMNLRRVLESSNSGESQKVTMSFMTDILRTIIRDIRANGNSLLFDAIGQIRRNLREGKVRLDDLCNSLNVCRSYLHRIFTRAGIGTPANLIKSEQPRLAITQLRRTDMPIKDIALSAGFISTTHFATFIKSRTGKTPTNIRRERF